MSRLNIVLAAVLVGQAGLGVVTWWPSSGPPPATALIDVQRDEITELSIGSGSDEGPVRLVRQGDSWNIASEAGYPAVTDKVDEVLDHLVGIQVRTPISTQAVHHASLGVSEADPGRSVQLVAGEQSWDLLLGAATGRSVNIRRADDDRVYQARGFSEWAIKDRARSYWDTTYLQLDEDALQSLTVDNSSGSLTLVHEAGDWTLAGLPEGASLAEDEVTRLVRQATRLRLKEPVGTEEVPTMGLDAGVRVSWTLDEGESTTLGQYRIGAEDDGDFFVKADSSPFVVKLASHSVSFLREVTAEDLIEGDE